MHNNSHISEELRQEVDAINNQTIKNMKPVIYILIAFALGSIKGAIAKELHLNSNIPLTLVVFCQFLICALFYLPRIIQTRGRVLATKRPLGHIFRSAFGVGYWYCMFAALGSLSLFDASVLVNLSPIWVLIFSSLFFGQNSKKELYFFALIGFCGCACILKPTNNIIQYGAIWAVMSGVFMACTIISVKTLVATEKSETIVIYYFFTAALFLLPFVPTEFNSINMKDGILLITNAILMLAHQLLLNKGLELGASTKLSLLAYNSVLFSLIIGLVVWQEIPDFISILGSLMIISSGFCIIKQTR